MNKKLIRLTEGDLHRIVKESVNRILTELDWKTYMNAGDKALARHDNERAKKFWDTAANRFEKDYGDEESDVRNRGGNLQYMQFLGGYPVDSIQGDFGSIKHKNDEKDTYVGYGSYDYPDNDHYSIEAEKLRKIHPKGTAAFDKMDKEYKSHVKGGTLGWKRLGGKSDYNYDSINNGGEGKWKRG